MKKILFFISSLRGGGAEKVLVTLVNQLCIDDNYDITVQVLYGGGIYHKELNERIHQKIIVNRQHKKIFQYLFMKLLRFMPAFCLHKMFIRDDYDMEIAYLEGISTKIISGGKRKNHKFAWVHIDPIKFPYSTGNYLNIKREIKCYKKFEKIFCVSESVMRAFKEKYNLSVNVIHNAVDDKIIKNKAEETFNEYQNYDCIKLVTVGRLEPQKGYDRLIRILGILKKLHFDFVLYILGAGSLKNELQELAKACNVEKNIIWKGFIENPYPYIKSADVFVCSSLTEGYSTVVTESIILGTPVITTDCAGMQEIFGDRECGIIADNSEEGLAEAMIDIFRNPNKINMYKSEAKKRSRDFSMEKQIGEFKKVVFGEND